MNVWRGVVRVLRIFVLAAVAGLAACQGGSSLETLSPSQPPASTTSILIEETPLPTATPAEVPTAAPSLPLSRPDPKPQSPATEILIEETPLPTATPAEVPTAAPSLPLSRPDPKPQSPPIVSALSRTENHISWRTGDGEKQLLDIDAVQKAYPDASLSYFHTPYLTSKVSPSRSAIAFQVQATSHRPGVSGYHLGLVSADGTLLGLYSVPPYNPTCHVFDFNWRPDEEGVVVQIAGPGCGRLVLLTRDARVVFDVETLRVKGYLHVRPDSRWAALFQGFAEVDGRIQQVKRSEFISLENPDIRLDVPISEGDSLRNELAERWIRTGG